MPTVSSAKFFQVQAAHSLVKAQIASRFVPAWLQVVLNFQRKQGREIRAAYVDLFAGPGSYDNGSKSTPLLILETVLSSPLLRSGFESYFNDSDAALIASLKQEITKLPNSGQLRFPPQYTNQTASIELIESFTIPVHTPQFFFLDQFGWANAKPALINKIFQARMCDCAFFLSTPRMIAAVNNPKTRAPMQEIFGKDGLLNLQSAFLNRSVHKEEYLLTALAEILKSAGAKFVLPFSFRIHQEQSSRHHLIYLGKHERGFAIMKDIMSKTSSAHESGVPILGYSQSLAHPSLFPVDPIDDLQVDLLGAFAGRTLTVGELFLEHHPTSNRFTLPSYQEALRRLESSRQISIAPPAANRPKRNGTVSMSELATVSFPHRS